MAELAPPSPTWAAPAVGQPAPPPAAAAAVNFAINAEPAPAARILYLNEQDPRKAMYYAISNSSIHLRNLQLLYRPNPNPGSKYVVVDRVLYLPNKQIGPDTQVFANGMSRPQRRPPRLGPPWLTWSRLQSARRESLCSATA